MKNISKKIFSFVLVLVMLIPCVSYLDLSVWAADSGTCGENLTWTLTNGGVLTISGTGALTDIPPDLLEYLLEDGVASIVIEKGVTSIGDSVFYCCTSFSSVTIPDSVTSIGDEAFFACDGLGSVIIPDSVTTIGDSAFEECTNLASVTISDSVTTIGDSVFTGCESLKSVTIPDSVTSIGEFAFAGCGLNSVIIPNSVTTIGYSAFQHCYDLTSVTIPNSVTSIGYYAFRHCYDLTSVTIPNSVTSIGFCAFSNCTSLKSVTIPDSVIIIEDYTFEECTSLISVAIPDSVTSIGSYAFSGCTNLASVTIPNSVTSIGYSAFEYCTSLESVTIHDSVTTIEAAAFDGCSEELTIFCYIDSYAESFAIANNIPVSYLGEPKEIIIDTFPDKLIYPIGGTLDTSGLSIRVIYDDGLERTITNGYTVSEYDFSTAGTKVITVSLCNASATFEVVVDQNLVVYPESEHPYANNSNITWTYTHPSEADKLIITFSDDTETESDYDEIYIYDANGSQVGVYSGTQLSNQSITIDGNSFSITLISDDDVTENGFKITSVVAVNSCDHTYGEWIERTAPSCTVNGEEYRVCSSCGAEDIRDIDSLGHTEGEWVVSKEATSVEEGLKELHCSVCDAVMETEVIPMTPSKPSQDLVFAGASLTLQDNLVINYKVNISLISNNGYENPYVVFELNGVKTIVNEYKVVGDKYVFDFNNIVPHNMNDAIYATLYATYNGVEYSSETREYSVASYCYNMLSKYTSNQYAKFRTLLVDLLNYGAASQTYMKYKTDDLVNAKLTDEQKAWGTTENRTLETVQELEYTKIDNPTVAWRGAGLNLEESIGLRFKIATDSIEGLTVKVKTDAGELTIDSSKFKIANGGYYVFVEGMHAGQMSEVVYITVYKDGVAVSNTLRYSIESYAYTKQNDSDTALANLIRAMMKYGDSAKASIS